MEEMVFSETGGVYFFRDFSESSFRKRDSLSPNVSYGVSSRP